MVNNDNTMNEYQMQHQSYIHTINGNSSNILIPETNDKNGNSNSFFPPLN